MGRTIHTDNDNLTEEGKILLEIAKRKGLTITELARRMEYSHPSNFRCRLLNDIRLSTLKKVCDVLGVELCIIDGWNKYTLSSYKNNKDLDTFLSCAKVEDNLKLDEKDDLWKSSQEREESKKVKQREAVRRYEQKNYEKHKEYMREYQRKRQEEKKLAKIIADGDICTICDNCIKKLEKDGKHYCTAFEEYRTEYRCKRFSNGGAEDQTVNVKW